MENIIQIERSNSFEPVDAEKNESCSWIMPDKLCSICEKNVSLQHSVYGVSACNSCRIFFLRTVRRLRGNLMLEMCKSGDTGSCDLQQLRPCQVCRYKKCLSMGMDTSLVKTSQEIKNKYFIKGATIKVTEGPKQARSWNKLFRKRNPVAIKGVLKTEGVQTVESEISPSPLSPKVSQQLVKMSQLEIQQPILSEHPILSAQTVVCVVSYQDGNNSTRCVDIDELSPQRTSMERQERLFPASCGEGYDKDEKISRSKKENHQKSAGGRDSGVLSKSWKKSTKVNMRRNLIEKNLHQSKITKVKEGESRKSSPTDWNSVFKKSIQRVKAQKQAPNLKRISEQITRTHRNLKTISDDIVKKKLDEAVKNGVLERIVKDEKVTFRVTRRPRFKVARKLLSTPSASPDLNGVGLDKNDFLAMLGLQEKVNV